jgi:hypothetical protein
MMAQDESFASVIWETSDDLSGVSAEALLNPPRSSAKLPLPSEEC